MRKSTPHPFYSSGSCQTYNDDIYIGILSVSFSMHSGEEVVEFNWGQGEPTSAQYRSAHRGSERPNAKAVFVVVLFCARIYKPAFS